MRGPVWLSEVEGLILPRTCAGCGEWDVSFCDDCAAPWWQQPFYCADRASRLMVGDEALFPVWAVAELDLLNYQAIMAWKAGGRRDLDEFFYQRFAAASGYLKLQLPEFERITRAPGRALMVVSVPSRLRSRLHRGVNLTAALARATAATWGVPRAKLLRATGSKSQGKSARERGKVSVRPNLWGRYLRRAWLHAPSPPRIVLVDDVLTTGATLAACAHQLNELGAEVVAAVVLASARPLGAIPPPALW